MSGGLYNVDIVTQPHLVDRYGPAGAIVLKQINYHADKATGWWEASYDDMRSFTGLKVRTCRTEVRKLEEAGALTRKRDVGTRGESKPLYRVADGVLATPPNIANRAGADRVTPAVDNQRSLAELAGDDSGTPGADRVTPTYVSENELNDSCPLDGDQQQLGKQVNLTDSAQSLDLFDHWWTNVYPNSTYDGRSRGKKTEARKAWATLHRQGIGWDDINDRTRRYAKAREVFRDAYGLGTVEAPLLNASTFLNGDHDNWADKCEGAKDERVRFWVGPLRAEIAAAKDAAPAPNAVIHDGCCDGSGIIDGPNGVSQCPGVQATQGAPA